MSKKYQLIIFDLDGTLLDTSKGIFNSVRYAEKIMGFNPIDDALLSEFIGPPPKLMYMKYHNIDEETALLAAKKHREYGRTKAIYEAELYPYVQEVLKTLRQRGYKLAVATLKTQSIAERILEYYGISKYFDVIVGMNDKENLKKADTILMVTKNICSPENAVMVGDTVYDYDGAKEIGVDFIGVTYGFGFSDTELYSFSVVKKIVDLLECIEKNSI